MLRISLVPATFMSFRFHPGHGPFLCVAFWLDGGVAGGSLLLQAVASIEHLSIQYVAMRSLVGSLREDAKAAQGGSKPAE